MYRTNRLIFILGILFTFSKLSFSQFTGGNGRGDFMQFLPQTLLNGSVSLAVSSINKSAFCKGDTIVVNYSVNQQLSAGNEFILQLSDTAGSFSNPMHLDTSKNTSLVGDFSTIIPVELAKGTKYRIRIVATLPLTISNDNGYDISVFEVPSEFLATVTGTVCLDSSGSLTIVSVTGGKSPFIFSIPEVVTGFSADSSFQKLKAGIYNVTIQDSNTCKLTRKITIPQEKISITNPPSDTSGCGTIQISYLPIANSNGVNFSWVATNSGEMISNFSTTGIGNLNENLINSGDSVGTVEYVITPAKETCIGTSIKYNVKLNPKDNADFTLADFCEGVQSGEPTINGVQGGDFFISPNTAGETISNLGVISGALGGTQYVVTYQTPSGICQNSFSRSVSVFSKPVLPEVALVNDTLFGPVGYSSYKWFVNSIFTGDTTVYLVPSVNAGSYQIEIADENGCSAISNEFSYQFTKIVQHLNNQKNFIYPNPANEYLMLTPPQNKKQIEVCIYNLMGKMVKHIITESPAKAPTQIDVTDLLPSVYFCEINDFEGGISCTKIRIER